TDTIALLMTNRVHPSRDWGNINPVRRAVARAAGLAHPMTGFTHEAAWYSGIGDNLEHSITVPVRLAGTGELALDLWFHTEPTDYLHIEVSTDDGDTWEGLDGTLTSGGDALSAPGAISGDGLDRWWDGRFPLAGLDRDVLLRLRYSTDHFYSGRGVYYDRIQLIADGVGIFDDWDLGDRARMQVEGWTRIDAEAEEVHEPV